MLDGECFANMLAYKCEKHGGIFIKVEPHFTSQECSTCGESYKKVSFYSYSHLHKMRYSIGSRSQRQPEYFAKRAGTITCNELNHSNCRARLCPNSIIFACGDCVRRNETPHYAVIMEAGSPFFNQSVRVIRRGYSQ